MLIPTRNGKEIIVVSEHPQNVAVRDVAARQIATVSVPASGIVRQTIH
jgi:hypothetical protein